MEQQITEAEMHREHTRLIIAILRESDNHEFADEVEKSLQKIIKQHN